MICKIDRHVLVSHRAVAGDTDIGQKPAKGDVAQSHGPGHACPAQVSRKASIAELHCLGTDSLDAYYTLMPRRVKASSEWLEQM